MNQPVSSLPSQPATIALPWTMGRAADYVALAKPRLNLLVVATTAAGYYLGALEFSALVMFQTVVGTALVAGGAAAFNQVLERDTDALMRRTRLRPLPDKRLSAASASLFAFLLSGCGLAVLLAGPGLLPAGIALITLASYALVYTPLKRRSSLATLVGGVPGALPPMIGWAAARGELSPEAWVLFAIVFLWQMPHFLAIAWLCREDYANAGLVMLPVVEPDGRSTAQQVLLYASVLLPVSLLPTVLGLAGRAYLAGALALGAGFLALSVGFAMKRSRPAARRLFLASIAYLPLVWALMLWNH